MSLTEASQSPIRSVRDSHSGSMSSAASGDNPFSQPHFYESLLKEPEGGRSVAGNEDGDVDIRPMRSPKGEFRLTSFIQGRKISMIASTVNVMNAILGSGILALPFVMSTCGIVVFLVLMVGMAMVTDYSIHLLIRACRETGKVSYEDIGMVAFGKMGKIVVALAICLQNTGAMCSYLVVAGDLLPNIVETFANMANDSGAWWADRKLLILVAVVIVVLPLAMLPSIGLLGYASFAAIASVVLFALFTFVKYFSIPTGAYLDPIVSGGGGGGGGGANHTNGTGGGNGTGAGGNGTGHHSSNDIVLAGFSLDTFLAIPTMCFSFVCHTTLLPVYAELKSADAKARSYRGPLSIRRMSIVSHSAIFVSTALYIVGATFG